jgi:Tfp pilus assembly protein PilX
MGKRARNKGVALFIVIATIFVLILLANIILNLMLSQSRLTHHQVSRIQAYYASLAGVNYTYDALRRGAWVVPGAGASDTHCISRNAGECAALGIVCTDETIDSAFPSTIECIQVVVSPSGVNGCDPPTGSDSCISATSHYAYTP